MNGRAWLAIAAAAVAITTTVVVTIEVVRSQDAAAAQPAAK